MLASFTRVDAQSHEGCWREPVRGQYPPQAGTSSFPLETRLTTRAAEPSMPCVAEPATTTLGILGPKPNDIGTESLATWSGQR